MGAAWVGGCTLSNDGADPDPTAIDFPISLLARGDDLIVVNSNFNLSKNGAVVQRFSRQALENAIAADQDGVVPTTELLTDIDQSVVLDSHSARAAFSLDGRFVYIPVRSQPSLTVLELTAAGGIECGQGAGRRCAESSRSGVGVSNNERAVSFPSDPIDMVVGDLSRFGGPAGDEFLVLGHGGGRASLFFRNASVDPALRPELVDVLTDLPENISAVTLEESTGLFWMTSSATGVASDGQIARIGLVRDASSPLDSFLFQVDGRSATGTSANRDTRDVQFGTRGGNPVAYVLARSPESLWVVDLTQSSVELEVSEILPVGVGPTELVPAELMVNGVARPILLVACFNAREIYVIDAEQRTTLAVIRGAPGRADLDRDAARLSGPYTMAFSPAGALPARLYIADFRASTIRVVNFAPLIACLEGTAAMSSDPSCEPTIIGTLGVPRPVDDLL